jgi:hypothetical protein
VAQRVWRHATQTRPLEGPVPPSVEVPLADQVSLLSREHELLVEKEALQMTSQNVC